MAKKKAIKIKSGKLRSRNFHFIKEKESSVISSDFAKDIVEIEYEINEYGEKEFSKVVYMIDGEKFIDPFPNGTNINRLIEREEVEPFLSGIGRDSFVSIGDRVGDKIYFE